MTNMEQESFRVGGGADVSQKQQTTNACGAADMSQFRSPQWANSGYVSLQ